jgi:superfamily II DNA or RNA helicase
MLPFSDWFMLKESPDALVSGPGVDRLRARVIEMGGRGAPTERNDFGFNHGDWTAYQRLSAEGHLRSEGVPVRIASLMLRMLSHYVNTQVPDFREINRMVELDIATATGSAAPEEGEQRKAIIYDRQPLEYGKVKVYVSGNLDRSTTVAINRVVDAKFAEEGAEKQTDKWGKTGYQRFKKFSADRSGVNLYRVHRDILRPVADILKSKGFAVEWESGSPAQQTAQAAPSRSSADVEIIGKERTGYGEKLAVKFDYDRSKGLFQRMKTAGMAPRAISYAGEGKFLINIDQRDQFDLVVNAIKEFGLDASPLERFAPGHFTKEREAETANDASSVSFADAEGAAIDVRVDYRRLTPERKEFVRECIQYTFPDYRWEGPPAYRYRVAGNYKQYISFGRLLKRFGFEVDSLREILRKKAAEGRLEKTEWEGRFDRDDAFMSGIQDRFPESSFELYDEQKFGVAFLYGRDSAILGDSTGVGKTIQLIKAAALRMKDSGKPTLIVTLKSVQKQFAGEIVSVMGEGERGEISTDPLNPGKWTVLYYENFSSGKRLDEVIEKLSSTGFGVVIFDELHKIKHGKTKRSQNISKVVSTIPTRWGASATVSSNKPMDVKNQLEMIGHHLGRVDKKKFKRDFVGEARGRDEDQEEAEIMAAERLNKWLNLSGVYVRREKGELRKMPDMKVGDEVTSIDQGRFSEIMSSTLSGYKDPDLPISRLIAAREAIARLKTGETTRRVLEIVRSGEGKAPAAGKVVVFTNFVEAARVLVDRIGSELKGLNPRYKVITYLSDTKKRERDAVKRVFTDDPDAKVLVMSMRMGGTGIDFPNASQNMVINDFDWTPEAAEQSEGRIYRINTDHPVNITYVVGDGLDRSLFERVRRKREIAAIIQRYRREYHDTDDKSALKKIVDAQKEIKEIDRQMAAAVAAQVPGAEGAMQESFRGFLEMDSAFLLG